jgi:plasmid stabilization system protein ParE
MTVTLLLTPAAERDLADAIEWYEAARPGLSCDFRLAVEATLNRIVNHPEGYAVTAHGLRRALLSRFSYAIFYRRRETVIQVVGILHTSRDPRIWLERDH